MNKYEKKLAIWRKKPFVAKLIQAFPEAEIFLVGGMVRDTILGRDTKDIDIVVRNVSKNKLESYLSNHGKVNLVGKRFGVFKFRPKKWTGTDIDIALPRTEHSINHTGAYKDFKISSNAKLEITDDLSRRDFTINAIAWDIKRGMIVDPYRGLADIKKKKIKTVGEPKDRFEEDYSRMLRAIRFSCQLGFDIDSKTRQAIITEIKKLTKLIAGKPVVPYEVIATELTKTVVANPVQAMKLLDTYGVLNALAPELLKMKKCPQSKRWHSEGDVWKHTLLALEKLSTPQFKKEFKEEKATSNVVWALIFHDVGKPYTLIRTDRVRTPGHDIKSAQIWRDVSSRLKLAASGVDAEAVEKIIAKHMLVASTKASPMKNITIEKYFYSETFPGAELMMVLYADIGASIREKTGKPDFTEYKKLKKQISAITPKGKKTPPKTLVDGKTLIKKLKVKQGPTVGKLLAVIREAQLGGDITTQKQALNLAKKHL